MGFPNWTSLPLSGLSLSTGGLLALADLSTIAQRTVIAGGSSWLDSFLLAPGLHYQQAADALVQQGIAGPGSVLGPIHAVEMQQDGRATTFVIKNAATRHYIERIARPGQVVTLDVGALAYSGIRYRMMRSGSGFHATVWAEDRVPDLGWISHLLYLISPALTVLALIIIILLQDWWAVGALAALIFARVLNIFVIKKRSGPAQNRPKSTPEGSAADQDLDGPSATATTTATPSATATPSGSSQSRLTEYVVSVGDSGSSVRLRGTPDDLRAITADAWLRTKTYVDGYLEAAAKLLVYLVAGLSGNMTQAGAAIFMALLLVSAGLLALSNANAKSFRMNGRVAAPLPPAEIAKILEGQKEGRRPSYPNGVKDDHSGVNTANRARSTVSDSGGGLEDLAEKGQAGNISKETPPLRSSVELQRPCVPRQTPSEG